jgi:hypothetical protein
MIAPNQSQTASTLLPAGLKVISQNSRNKRKKSKRS